MSGEEPRLKYGELCMSDIALISFSNRELVRLFKFKAAAPGKIKAAYYLIWKLL